MHLYRKVYIKFGEIWYAYHALIHLAVLSFETNSFDFDIKGYNSQSSVRKGTCFRKSVWISTTAEAIPAIPRNSTACRALSNSIPKMVSTFATTSAAFTAPFAPMLTWSSCPLLESIVSTDAGVQSCLFLLTMLAAVYCGIIKPEFRPASVIRNGGNLRSPPMSL